MTDNDINKQIWKTYLDTRRKLDETVGDDIRNKYDEEMLKMQKVREYNRQKYHENKAKYGEEFMKKKTAIVKKCLDKKKAKKADLESAFNISMQEQEEGVCLDTIVGRSIPQKQYEEEPSSEEEEVIVIKKKPAKKATKPKKVVIEEEEEVIVTPQVKPQPRPQPTMMFNDMFF